MSEQQSNVAKTFDEYQNSYGDAVNNAVAFTGMGVDFFTKVKADYLLDHAKGHFGDVAPLEVLDIGCGVGTYHGLLQGQFDQLNGVDVSEACVARAKETHGEVAYQVYDGDRLPYENDSMDLAFTICVVHHVPPENWPRFFGEAFRIVRPGGLFLVFEHNPLNPLTMRAVNNCPFDEDAVLLRSAKTRQLMEGGGFSASKARFILNIPAANGVLRTVDGFFSPLCFGAQYFVAGVKPS